VILAQRRIEARLGRLETGTQREDRIWTSTAYDECTPRVTVVVTLYNYGRVVGEALASVAASQGIALEVVVVDDASTDDSAESARAAIERHPWLAAKLIARGANGGLAAARNLGIAHARGGYVFMLDADNAVYPHALARLAAALDEDDGAAFAYGIIERFDAAGSTDLMSWHPWDPQRFRQGNYIDAMAMARKGALEGVGGFTEDNRLFGWEDFALWCSFAQAGLRGRLVPEILCRYRTNRHSMIAITNIDVSEAWSVLIERFSFLLSDDANTVRED
jgi:glycosyltransferase involved in cell wall biosynthesis